MLGMKMRQKNIVKQGIKELGLEAAI